MDAIRSGDADRADRAARYHVESWTKRLVEHVADEPGHVETERAS